MADNTNNKISIEEIVSSFEDILSKQLGTNLSEPLKQLKEMFEEGNVTESKFFGMLEKLFKKYLPLLDFKPLLYKEANSYNTLLKVVSEIYRRVNSIQSREKLPIGLGNKSIDNNYIRNIQLGLVPGTIVKNRISDIKGYNKSISDIIKAEQESERVQITLIKEMKRSADRDFQHYQTVLNVFMSKKAGNFLAPTPYKFNAPIVTRGSALPMALNSHSGWQYGYQGGPIGTGLIPQGPTGWYSQFSPTANLIPYSSLSSSSSQDPAKKVFESPSSKKWVNTFLKKLLASLKTLPMFQVMKKGLSDLIRLQMLMYASNRNNPKILRQLALLGTALKVPETLGNITETGLGTFGALLAERQLTKFAGKLASNKPITAATRAKNIARIKIARGVTPLALAGLGVDLLTPMIDNAIMNQNTPKAWKSVQSFGLHATGGALTGAGIGGLLGGIIGSIAPGLGTAVGLSVGTKIGAIIGGFWGSTSSIQKSLNAIEQNTRKDWNPLSFLGGSSHIKPELKDAPHTYFIDPLKYQVGSMNRDQALKFAKENPSYWTQLVDTNYIKVRGIDKGIPYANKTFQRLYYQYATDWAKKTGSTIVITGGASVQGSPSSKSPWGHGGGLKLDSYALRSGVSRDRVTQEFADYMRSVGFLGGEGLEAKGSYANPTGAIADIGLSKQQVNDINKVSNALTRAGKGRYDDLTDDAFKDVNSVTKGLITGKY